MLYEKCRLSMKLEYLMLKYGERDIVIKDISGYLVSKGKAIDIVRDKDYKLYKNYMNVETIMGYEKEIILIIPLSRDITIVIN